MKNPREIMLDLQEYAQECYNVLTEMESDIKPFREGKMKIYHDQKDVTQETIERVAQQIADLRRLHGKLVAGAKGL